jgi:UDP-N-acetylglucosamine 2-epimerase (non-hydrolysing)
MTPAARSGRVLAVVGTRPEAIKMAPVVRALRERGGRLEVKLVLTGQHDELVDEALAAFAMDPDWDLEIMREGQTLAEVARACVDGIDRVVGEWRPDVVLVQGDTASVFFGGLLAYFHRIPTGHVEAGLRTGDLYRPFPEEGFRRLVDVLAELHFAPTEGAKANLLREGVPEEHIFVTGNTVVDALLQVADRGIEPANPELRRLVRPGAPPFALLTAHRRESLGAPLERVFGAVADLVRSDETLEVIFPVHPNPPVQEAAGRILGDAPRIHLVPPLAYPDLVAALANATLVLTDSGGIQEEAPTFGTPVLVLREVTERPEVIEAGLARLVGTDPARILEEARRLLASAPSRGERERRRRANPYGDGHAGERIAAHVEAFLGARRAP